MTTTLQQLATRIDATVQGDGSHEITACAGLDDATASQISFLANRKYASKLKATHAGAVIVSKKDATGAPQGLNLLVADDPYYAFRQALVELHGYRQNPVPGISAQAVIHPDATLGDNVTIEAFVYIEAGAAIGSNTVIYPHCYIGSNATVGEDCQLYPNVTIYDHCVLGNRVTLHAGCVIGQDGFGYATHQCEGEPMLHHKIPQVGNAVIEDDVEMGAGCTIDRAAVGSTVIGQGTKFSNLIAIGHGAKIGPHNLFVAQVGVAGSTSTGAYVVMGGQVGVAGHLNIGDGVQLAGKAGVMTDIPAGQKWGGQPAIPLADAKRNVLTLMKLSDISKDLKQMEKRIAALEENEGDD